MTVKDNLPATTPDPTDALVVFEPPASFEVIDRGPGDKVEFKAFGDSFLGIYQSTEEALDKDGKTFLIAHFVGYDGMPYDITPGAGLRHGISLLEHGQWARITYTFDVDTGKNDPMKCFTVEVGR